MYGVGRAFQLYLQIELLCNEIAKLVPGDDFDLDLLACSIDRERGASTEETDEIEHGRGRTRHDLHQASVGRHLSGFHLNMKRIAPCKGKSKGSLVETFSIISDAIYCVSISRLSLWSKQVDIKIMI